jgi:hypothetical protein
MVQWRRHFAYSITSRAYDLQLSAIPPVLFFTASSASSFFSTQHLSLKAQFQDHHHQKALSTPSSTHPQQNAALILLFPNYHQHHELMAQQVACHQFPLASGAIGFHSLYSFQNEAIHQNASFSYFRRTSAPLAHGSTSRLAQSLLLIVHA